LVILRLAGSFAQFLVAGATSGMMAVGARIVTVAATRAACMLVHDTVCVKCQLTYDLLHGRRVVATRTKHPRWLVCNQQNCVTLISAIVKVSSLVSERALTLEFRTFHALRPRANRVADLR